MHSEKQGTRSRTNLGCSTQSVLITAALLILLLAGVWMLGREPSAEQAAKTQLAIERAKALQPWNTVLSIIWRMVVIGAGLALLLSLVAALRAGAHWLDTRARLIHADQQTGQFPAIKIRRGEAVVDLNRLPDGKAMTGIVGGKVGLLLVLLFRYVLGKEVPELSEQPAVILRPPDTSPEQIQITSQAQAAQALAAASRRTTPAQAVEQFLLRRPIQRGLPPLLVEEQAPREVQLLLEAGKRQWDRRQDDRPTYDVEAL